MEPDTIEVIFCILVVLFSIYYVFALITYIIIFIHEYYPSDRTEYVLEYWKEHFVSILNNRYYQIV